MRPELAHEIERLETILLQNGLELSRAEGVAPEIVERIEQETGIVLDQDVRDFFTFSNGSDGETWGAVMSDQVVPIAFESLEENLDSWRLFFPYDEARYEEWSQPGKVWDRRVQPEYVHHRKWFPIAEFGGHNAVVYFDADPTPEGRHGQIIVYQHDPDAVYYVAESFLAFFRSSNDLLAEHAAELLEE